MNAQILKQLNEHLPDWIKWLAAPIIHRKLTNNKAFVEQYAELEEWEKLSPLQKGKKQVACLRDALVYAYEHTEYYHRVFDEIPFQPRDFNSISQLDVLPVMNKETIRQHFNEMIAESADDYYSTTTGGSTGKPLPIQLDKKSIFREKAFIYHYWSRYGYDYHSSKIATFRGLEFNGKCSKINPVYNEIQLNPFMLSTKTVRKYVDLINKFGAEFLHGYPSTIYSFCCCLEEEKIELQKPIRAVFFISENVYPFQKEKVESVLNCRTHAFYGHSERAVFAEQQEDGDYIFQPAYGYAETNQNGNLLCTGFINMRMPLVRYDTEDTALLTDNQEYKICGHRQKEVLYGLDGQHISVASVNFHTETMWGVAAYQFVQNEKGYAQLLLVPLENNQLDTQKIEKVVRDKVGPALHITAKQVEKVVLSKRGKYQMIIQNVKI